MSLGFAFDNGNIQPIDEDTQKLLHMLAERVELGVRTDYDAEFLNKYNIKNVKVIGCPSMFYHMDRNFRIDDSNKNLERINFNFTTDFCNLGISPKEAVYKHWPMLLYFIHRFERNELIVDFTMQKPPFMEITDIQRILLSYGEVHEFYKECGRYFYSVEDWINGIKGVNDFSIGSRFHGNVAAILSGIPTLMVNVDKRMEGMNRFFKIPSIDIKDFDVNKPIEYYRELADYSEFNKNYKKVYDNFIEYCAKNGVELNGI